MLEKPRLPLIPSSDKMHAETVRQEQERSIIPMTDGPGRIKRKNPATSEHSGKATENSFGAFTKLLRS